MAAARRAARLALCLAALAAGAWAHADNRGGSVQAKLIGDRVLTRVLLQTQAFQLQTHVIFDYAAPEAFVMHQVPLNSLAFGENEETLKVLVIADAFRLEIPKERITPEQGLFLTEFTARHANELDNVDVAAVIGWPTLRPFALDMHIAEGELTLTPGAQADLREAEQWAAAVVRGVRVVGDQVHVPVSYGGGEGATMTFATAGYHTYLRQEAAERLGRPAGDVDGIDYGAPPVLPLSGMVALFPQPFDAPPDDLGDEWLLRSGLGLWSGYRLQINPDAGYLALSPVVDSNHSAADAAFYAAAAAEDIDALRAYTKRWPEDRNVEEAAGRMFDIGLRAGLDDEAQMAAVAIGLSVTPEKRKTHYVSGFAFQVFGSERKDERASLVAALGEEALVYIGRSDNPAMRQHIQLMLGDRYLHAGDAHRAWKTFLSAAFYGDPRFDGFVRHELGRAYEALQRNRRAYSSYQRAAAARTSSPDIKESARAGLARLRPLLEPDDPLLAEDASGG